MSDDFLENLTAITDNLNDISFTRYVTIININDDGTVDCQEDNGTEHKNVINTTQYTLSIDDTVILGFVDNDIYNPIITAGVNVKRADDQMIYALGLGLFEINHDGDLILTLPIGVDNYFSINADGDLIVDLDDSQAEKFSLNGAGEVVYEL